MLSHCQHGHLPSSAHMIVLGVNCSERAEENLGEAFKKVKGKGIDKEMDAIFADAINMIRESRFCTVAQHRKELIKSAWSTVHCGGVRGLYLLGIQLLRVNLLCTSWRKSLCIGLNG